MHSLRPCLWTISVLATLLAWQPAVQCQPVTAEAPAKEAAPADQAPRSTVAKEFASPRNTIETFLINSNRLAEDPKDGTAKRLVLKTLEAPETAGDERLNIAVKLLGVMNALGRIDVETMAPGVKEVTKQNVSRFEFFPDNSYPAAARLIREAISEIGSAPPGKIILERMDSGEWKFSSETVDGIGQTWSWIGQRGVRHGIDVGEYSTDERLRRALIPEVLKGRFVLGLELWQWVGLFAIVFLALLIDYASRVVLRPPVRWLLRRSTGETDPLHERLTLRPIGLLLGGLGIAGLAVSFAAQDMIRNLFGGMTVFLDRPFKIGDRIIYRDIDGIVENVGFRSTKVRTLADHLVTVPNGGLTADTVENISMRTTIRRIMNLKLAYDTPPEKVREGLEIVRSVLAEDPIRESINPVVNGDVLEPRAYCNDITPDGVAIFVIYWFSPPAYWDYLEHAERLNLRLLEELGKAGIELAYPAQTLNLRAGSAWAPTGEVEARMLGGRPSS